MKKLLIPSVVGFNLKDRVVDVLAKELFNIVRNLGSRFEVTHKIDNLEKSNNYLNQQFERLVKYARNGEIEKFDFLAKILLKNSKVYLVYTLNHCFGTWHGMRFTKVIKLLKKVMKFAQEEESELHYKRVWIDKKPGDYGRPLGVPNAEDRIYGHMITRIMEAYLFGTDQYTDNQHGGRPGRGVMTFLIALAEKVKTAPRIFEFDIKGFFDHIDHDVILGMFKSQVILKYLKGALTSRPISYTLPPEEMDKAVKLYSQIKSIDKISVYNLIPEMENHIAFYENYMANPSSIPISEAEQEMGINTQIAMDLLSLELSNAISYYKNAMEGVLPPINSEDEESVNLRYVYGELMKLDTSSTFESLGPLMTKGFPYMEKGAEAISVKDREQGRDSWKDLSLEGKGVPQGSNFGPVVASVLLGKVMPRNSLLYMDDGLIFCKERTLKGIEYMETEIRVKKLGCELAPEKSRMLRTKDLMTEGFKIVGTRWQQSRSYFNYSVSSETRRGLKRKLFPDLKDNYLEILCGLYAKGYISASKHKMLKWYLDKGDLKRVRESSLFAISEKIGIFGNILSKAYSPTVSLEEMKAEIEYGIFISKLRMYKAEGSLGQRLISCLGKVAVEASEKRVFVKPSIHNIRSISSDILLRYLKGELPVRNLRVQGLRKPFKK